VTAMDGGNADFAGTKICPRTQRIKIKKPSLTEARSHAGRDGQSEQRMFQPKSARRGSYGYPCPIKTTKLMATNPTYCPADQKPFSFKILLILFLSRNRCFLWELHFLHASTKFDMSFEPKLSVDTFLPAARGFDLRRYFFNTLEDKGMT
jgi:hypothetical protein